jgi:outer membrane immunogenic protein
MKRSIFVGSLAIAVFTGVLSAQAADLPPRPPAFYKAAPPQAYNWSGFYAGLNAGYGWGRSSWSDPAAGADFGRFNTSGGLAGGQLGYNWQTGNAVFGIETDMDWMNLKGSSAAAGVCATDGGGQCQTQQSWLGTTRARAGYAFDRWLPYITGGLAYGNIQAPQINGSSTATKTGWAAGAGVEYGIDRNWSAKLEYLHIDLGTATFRGGATGASNLSVPVTDNLVKAGINYHW